MTLRRELHLLLAALAGVLLARLALLATVPLIDLTEARYADIARLMVERADWITLWTTGGRPFWGKPPLSTWLSAAGIQVFGVNEFAVRFPMWLVACAVVAATWRFGRALRDGRTGLLAALLLAAMPAFWISAGAVMTDLPLLLSIVLAQWAGWQALAGRSVRRGAGYALFAALGAGLLAKGPLVGVLVLPPLVAWALLTGRARLLAQLPWFGGTLLMLAIALPWYGAAELRTPGFLQYFIVGEHLQRFLQPGWTGDLYGKGHHQPLGMIWLYLAAGTLPWWVLALAMGLRRATLGGWWRALRRDSTLLYLLLCALAPLLLFTLARNILWTYVLPALPASALLLADLLGRRRAIAGVTAAAGARAPVRVTARGAAEVCAVAALALLLALAVATALRLAADRTDLVTAKPLLAAFEHEHPGAEAVVLVVTAMPNSADFYGAPHARPATLDQAIAVLTVNPNACAILTPYERAEAERRVPALLVVVAEQAHDALVCHLGPANAP